MNTSLRFLLFLFSLLLVFSFETLAQKGQLSATSDTIDLYPFVDKYVNLLANDTIPMDDTIWRIVVSSPYFISKSHDSVWNFTFYIRNWGHGGNFTGFYKIYTTSDPPDTCRAEIVFRVHDQSYDSLYLNNVNARFNAYGNNFLGTDDRR